VVFAVLLVGGVGGVFSSERAAPRVMTKGQMNDLRAGETLCQYCVQTDTACQVFEKYCETYTEGEQEHCVTVGAECHGSYWGSDHSTCVGNAHQNDWCVPSTTSCRTLRYHCYESEPYGCECVIIGSSYGAGYRANAWGVSC